ncbi:tetratricopeptide repeat protein [Haliangium ochraceum]|uniref:Tetratricopeptide TPR_2 repeat protein n=1 Tax=Haliangium ochraceum (strain DSM 14365 / JCM 11303 / SMP-2) TaxID=502025 RepID=D0LI82_HALO1|nr:tetratricopeptide repeat protein [Haliangium ochraceum]ACY16461.1 Tetratricopeptide TPR_2 repeat protein [Haliangium ochraceum DSM 14365]
MSRSRTSTWSWLACAMLAAALAAGCGASSQQRVAEARADGVKEAPKLPPVAPEALTAFDEGMRWMRAAQKRKRTKPRREALDKARTALRRAVEIDGTVWEAWHNLGAIQFAEGDDEGATAAFGSALAVNPVHVGSLFGRAEAHRRAGRTDEARTDYEAAVAQSAEDSPQRRNATARLASLLREAKRYDDAVAVIRDTLRTSGANAQVYVELGMIYMAQGRDDLATLVLGKAAELDPELPSIYNAYALLALSSGRAQEAFERFDYATSLDPSYLDARFNKASVLLDAGDYARANEELAVVVAQRPEDMDAQVALGVALRGMGEYDQAKSQWEKVVQEAPTRSRVRGDALFNLAVLQMSFLEDEKGAVAAFERFLQEAPRNHGKRKAAEEKKKELGL